MSYTCLLCNKVYKSYKSFWKHNSIFHPGEKINNDNKIRNFCCNVCNKKFTTKQSMINHINNTCKSKNPTIETNQIKKELEELKKKFESISSNVTNTNNGTVNNINIYINKFGNENISDLSYNDAKNIFNKKIESLIKFVQLLNFNEKIPSNHNFCTTSLEGQYLSVYNTDTSEKHKERKRYFFEELLYKSVNRMEQLYNRYKDKFNKEKQHQIEEDINILKTIRDKDMNDILLREMLKKLNCGFAVLSYNYKEIVLATWNTCKCTQNNIVGMKSKTFEDDLMESDDDIKEIENLFIKVESLSESIRPELVFKKNKSKKLIV